MLPQTLLQRCDKEKDRLLRLDLRADTAVTDKELKIKRSSDITLSKTFFFSSKQVCDSFIHTHLDNTNMPPLLRGIISLSFFLSPLLSLSLSLSLFLSVCLSASFSLFIALAVQERTETLPWTIVSESPTFMTGLDCESSSDPCLC